MATAKTKLHTVNEMGFKEAAGKRWFISQKKMSPRSTLSIRFDDEKSYKYLSTTEVNVGDPVVIRNGGATSYKMGIIEEIENKVTIKKGHALFPAFAFSTDPTKALIKKNAENSRGLMYPEEIEKDFWTELRSNFKDIFVVTDFIIRRILNAITVIAFPELTDDTTIKKAKTFLKGQQTVPGFFFGYDMNDKYYGNWALDYIFAEFAFAGHYPGWKEEFEARQFWKESALEGFRTSCLLNDYNNNDLIYCSVEYDIDEADIKFNELADFFDTNEDFKEAMNELLLRSALSIIIRGGFVNLLEAALSVEMPIKGFYSKLVAFAEEIGSTECLNVLKDVDYENMVFDEPDENDTSENCGIDLSSFVIDNGKLMKYLGHDEHVVIPNGITEIGKGAFQENWDLKSVVISEGVNKIGGRAFYHSGVQEVTFPESITNIGSDAFWNCERLEKIELGSKVKSIGRQAFGMCKSVKAVKIKSPKVKISTDAFAFSKIKDYYFDSDEVEASAFEHCFNIAEGSVVFHCREGSITETEMQTAVDRYSYGKGSVETDLDF